MKNKIIKLIIKNAYGVDRVYPACEVAENLALLTKKKTYLINIPECLQSSRRKLTMLRVRQIMHEHETVALCLGIDPFH